ncbi:MULTISPECIES: hypothetical protein [Mesorhizobium]|uniref:hypothetical protein n=1 Tax=Mesorhizobium TaxID=68287 RepID=UPI0007A95D29|nr:MULTISPECIES: hypothetical protein [Mesorhizobium]AMX93745.1 hypothetical protein A4R28_11835 [Mesorhizobium ciceri]MDF3208446.1 hypothetical protein [Mesorhizobium sp. LMG15046]MDF3228983.1 hypothetical protein [Mesorhizobium sp. DSM 30133]RUU22102.1 hypothetical protein EOC84_03050 [Mesorhizobium sp. Primo-B]RUU37988.1 hypothetical protein EOC83_17165 [Mesorhizobium sp. Primo-A]
MNDFFTFAGAHPAVTFFLAWGIWPVCWTVQAVLTTPFSLAFKAYNRRLRSLNIRAHGWPANPLMDADGDIIHPPVANV